MFEGFLVIAAALFLLWHVFTVRKPVAPTVLAIHFKKGNPMTAVFTWTISVDPTVTAQTLVASVLPAGSPAGTVATPQAPVSLPSAAAAHSIPCNPGDQVSFTLTATSPGGTSSVASSGVGTAPTPLTPPAPPTNLAVSFTNP